MVIMAIHQLIIVFPIMIALCFADADLEEEVSMDIPPQCNATCRYVAWAFDANCRQRNLEAVPQECWEAKMLDLRDNKIINITAEAFQSFTNLLYVDLEENGITEIDTSAFIGNNRVRHIYLQSNRLEIIHRGTFTGVPNLLQLYLNSNRISTIETEAFSGLSKLETLFLSENNLDEITTGLLKGLRRLRYFHMTHNRLTALHNDTFTGLEHLRHLNLINNNIRTIDAGAFKGLMSLRVLRLAYNEISLIGYGAFIQMQHIIQLDLYSNQIQTISNFSTGINIIDELYLGDNLLKCDCQMEPLRLWYKEHFVRDSKANATCNTPENLKSRSIATLDKIVCPTPSEIPNEGFIKERALLSSKDKQVSKEDYLYQQYSAVETSTIAVIVVACVVLFAVCIIGLICFIYNAYFRPTYHSFDEQKGKYQPVNYNPQQVKIIENPLSEA